MNISKSLLMRRAQLTNCSKKIQIKMNEKLEKEAQA